MEGWLNRFLRTRPLAAVCCAVVLGAIAGVSAPDAAPVFLLCALPFMAAAALLHSRGMPHRFAACLCAVLMLSAGYGAWRAERPEMTTQRGVAVAGTVADAPEWQSDKLRAVFRLKDVTVDGEKADYDVRVYAYGEMALRITVADEVSMQTNLYEPDRAGNGGFDFQKYLWAEGVAQFASLESHLIQVTPRDGGYIERMAELRRHLQTRTDALFPQNSALIRGLTLGDRTDMSEADEAAFSDSGIMHLLAVSGLHVSILASLLTALAVVLCVPKAVVLVSVTLLLICYAMLCGGSPSIVRAVIMYIVMQGGITARRGSDDLTRLTFAAAVMVLYNPLYLWQTGFQLSFAAVAGLMLLTPTLYQMYERLPGVFRTAPARLLANMLLPGVAVQLGGLPIVLSAFGQAAWTSVFMNILCIPLAQLALVLSLLALAADMLIPVGAIAAAADILTGWLLRIAHWAAGLPVGIWQIPALLLPFAIVYGACIPVAGAHFRIRRSVRVAALCLMPIMVLGSAGFAMLCRSQTDFAVTFLDVGQGDAAVINAQGTHYLMDVGEDAQTADYIAAHHLDIEGIFLSHAHDDHAGGLADVLAVTDTEWICLPVGYNAEDADAGALEMIAAAQLAGVEIISLKAGDTVPLSRDISAQVLYPESALDGGNGNSMLLRVTYGEGAVLFTGDLPMKCEPMGLDGCSVLKVAHHGSGNATSSLLLAETQPTLAVISVGEGNLYGHPSPELLDRLEGFGCHVLRTDFHGAVTAYIDSDGGVRYTTHYPEDETE